MSTQRDIVSRHKENVRKRTFRTNFITGEKKFKYDLKRKQMSRYWLGMSGEGGRVDIMLSYDDKTAVAVSHCIHAAEERRHSIHVSV